MDNPGSMIVKFEKPKAEAEVAKGSPLNERMLSILSESVLGSVLANKSNAMTMAVMIEDAVAEAQQKPFEVGEFILVGEGLPRLWQVVAVMGPMLVVANPNQTALANPKFACRVQPMFMGIVKMFMGRSYGSVKEAADAIMKRAAEIEAKGGNFKDIAQVLMH